MYSIMEIIFIDSVLSGEIYPKGYFKDVGVKTQDDYNIKLIEEIQKARREMKHSDMLIPPKNYVENFDDDMSSETGIPLDFFDELNS